MAGIKALFNARQIRNVIERFQKDVDEKTLLGLQFLGEEFVNNARLSGNYQDRTGNLRSSIGYIILLDGKIIDRNFEGNNTGRSQAVKVANEVANNYPKGYVLIGVAGMNYAAYVEAKNYDVITGSAPGSNDIKEIFNAIKS